MKGKGNKKIMMKKNQAFTLIELMIVVAIIALLATMGISSYSNAVKKARDGKKKADIQTIATALTLYRGDEREYPVSLGDLATKKYLATVPDATNDDGQVNYTYKVTNKDNGACDNTGNNLCKKFIICTESLEYPRGNANSSTNDKLTTCANDDNAEGNACVYYCVENQ